MSFRFSLKWLLAVMVYAALVAVAFGQPHWAYGDLLWTLSMAAFGYALVVTCLARGPRQARAVGFAVFFACFMLCLVFAPDSVPSARMLTALGAEGGDANQSATIGSPPGATFWSGAAPRYGGSPAQLQVQSYSGWVLQSQGASTIVTSPASPAALGKSYLASLSFPLKLRSANALSALLAGLAGALLASWAFRQQRSPAIDNGATSA
jgi:hypothetical protein